MVPYHLHYVPCLTQCEKLCHFLVQSYKYFGFDLILFGTQVMTWFIAFPESKMFVKEGSSRPFFPMKLTLNIKLSNIHGGLIVLTSSLG